jgi:uracil-DNA glycosylase family 4
VIDQLINCIPEELKNKSGEVFYSGANAFSGKKQLYILGINPGGSPEIKIKDTVIERAKYVLEKFRWSEYIEGQWGNYAPGKHPFQQRVQHLLKKLNLQPEEVPASNLVFVRSPREKDIDKEKYKEYTELCWKFHETVIDFLEIEVILCLGNTPGKFVRNKLCTRNRPIDTWAEQNNRRWKTKVYKNGKQQKVIVVPHPSISNWLSEDCDPSHIISKHFKVIKK